MARRLIFVSSVSFLFLCTSGLGQSTSNDSQGMQALVAEVRQLRKDLQASSGYAVKAQVLRNRLQFQQAAVARASERLSDARVRCSAIGLKLQPL
jgi:hypothetical protein